MKQKNLILICAIGGIALAVLLAIVLIFFVGKDSVPTGADSFSSATSSLTEESSVTSAPETTTTTETTTPEPETTTTPVPETDKPEEITTSAPETEGAEETTSNVSTQTTEAQTEATTDAPESSAPEAQWKEESCSGEMYVITSCYSRIKAVLGAETVKLYNVNELVKVTAKTDTGYYKTDAGSYIHSDYLSTEKVSTTTTAKQESKPEEDDGLGYTEDGDKILAYNGNGYPIIGYTPDGIGYLKELEDSWVVNWAPDGQPICIIKPGCGGVQEDNNSYGDLIS